MPTFTAITLDRLLEPMVSKSMTAAENVPDSKLERRYSSPNLRRDKGSNIPPKREKGSSLLSSETQRKSRPSAASVDKKNHWTQISPALYATPKSTPIPDSPSSFPPSPYVINHKRRGPRLLKSSSEDDVAASQRAVYEQKAEGNALDTQKENASSDDTPVQRGKVDHLNGDGFIPIYHNPVKIGDENCSFHLAKENNVNGTSTSVKYEPVNSSSDKEIPGRGKANSSSGQSDAVNSATLNLQQTGEVDDFLDPQGSMSLQSNTESDVNSGLDRSANLIMSVSEFYDAPEELSSESGPQPPVLDIEGELREIRLSFLMEIEKRKKAEEALSNMQNQWRRICSQLSSVGLTLPEDAVVLRESEQLDDPAEDLCQQVYLTRFVSNSIGRGSAKAEVEMEMTAQLELKNFEIVRLSDRLHYYETVNREMSQRNQEAVDTARRLRQRRKKRLRWIWGSIATAITLGSTVLAWSYFSTGEGPSASDQARASEVDHAAEQ